MSRKRKACDSLGEPSNQISQPKSKPYKYDLLLPCEIRVLVLYPGTGDDPLCGTLETNWLDEEPKYQAISYAWGEPDFVHELRLDLGSLKITKSLYGALRRFRDARKPVRLWADAVCINQWSTNGSLEKNHQVAMMGDVYSDAEEVLIWLGEADKRDAMFFWLLPVLAMLNRRDDSYGLTRRGVMDSMPFPPGDNLGPSCSCCGIRCQLVEASWHEALSSIVEFWAKPWFQRLWVVQEKSLARQSTIFCGPHRLEMNVLHDAWAYLWRYFHNHRDSSARNGRLLRVIELSVMLSQPSFNRDGIAGLMNALIETSRLESYLPHDRFFAIKGICPILNKVLPSIDYSLSEYVLWQSVTAALITDERNWHGRQGPYMLNAGFLLVMAGLQQHEPTSTLPSWVPDYRRMPENTDRLWAKRTWYADIMSLPCAGGIILQEYAPAFMKGTGMTFKGVILGDIERISPNSVFPGVETLLQKNLTTWTVAHLLPWIRTCNDFVLCPDAPGYGDVTPKTLTLLLPSIEDSILGIDYLHALESLLVIPVQINGITSTENETNTEIEKIAGAVGSSMPWQYHIANAGVLLAKSSGGQFCWIPPHAMVGDKVCLLNDVDVPFIMRSNGKESYRLVGDAYVHGVMYGEAWPGNVPDRLIYEEGEWVRRPVRKLPAEDLKPIQDIVLI